jgi:Fe-S cluster biogenesis protein NfuA
MDSDLKSRVQSALDTMRPFLKADGGDAELLDISDDMHVKIRLIGTCSTCDLSQMTMKAGIEQAIIKAIPEIASVEAVV